MPFLIDTNVLSELQKTKPHPQVAAWWGAHSGVDSYISVLVVGEVRRGIEGLRGRDPERAAVLEGWLTGLTGTYRERILPITVEIADAWGRLNAKRRSPSIDGLMAATAFVHGLTLVTRNISDFPNTEVQTVNPFD